MGAPLGGCQHVNCSFFSIQKKVVVKEKPLYRGCVDSSDVFILDLGLEVYQVSDRLPSQ